MDCGDREERGERKALLGGRRIVEQQAGRAAAGSRDSVGGQPAASGREALVAKRRVENLRVEQGKCRRVEEEALELEQPRALGAFCEQRRARAQERLQRHHAALPQVVDRRVRHLREALAEERVERSRTPGERRQRAVVAHRRDRLVAVRGGGPEHERQILARVAGQHVARAQVARRRKHRLARGELATPDGEPAQVRAAGGQRALDVVVQLDAATGCVDREHLAGTELAAAHARVVRQRDRARLRRARHEAVVGDRVAKRSQPVAVDCGADNATVGEDDAGRPVPGLDQAGVVAVERAHSRIELGIVLPRRRQEHRHRVTDVAAAAREELDGVVEHRGVRARFVEDGRRQPVSEPRLARAHPRDVAAKRVDLTVVAEEPERLCALPRG